MGGVHLRRDSVLGRFALGEIHFWGISDDGFWNGGILSYSQEMYRVYHLFVIFTDQKCAKWGKSPNKLNSNNVALMKLIWRNIDLDTLLVF